MRVLHCPSIVAGNAQQLARAEREIGLESDSVSFFPSPFGYDCDEILCPSGSGRLKLEWRRWELLLRAMRHYDVIHFNFGQTIMPQVIQGHSNSVGSALRLGLNRLYGHLFELVDLKLLRMLGKSIFVTFQGDDARQGRYLGNNFEISFVDEVESGYYSEESDERKQWRIKEFERYTDGMFSLNPDLLHVLPKHSEFMPYCHIDLRQWTFSPRKSSLKPLIVHAPSHRGVKGSRFIIQAFEELKSEGLSFEFKLVENMPQHEARAIYEQADLLVDQLLAGWYGGLAVEAMALGVPVVCFLREGDLTLIPQEMRIELPLIRSEPGTIKQVLRSLITDRREELPVLGWRSRKYVERWHDPLRIAQIMKGRYEQAIAKKRTFSGTS